MHSQTVNLLHSRYNPRGEAERYINSLNLKSTIECFILIEPGLGYIIPVLRENFQKSKIIVLHVDNSFASEEIPENVTVLHSSETEAVQNYLEKEVPEIDASLIKIIEWRPSMNHYREAYIKLFSHAVEFIKRMDAGKRTTAVFGRRWFKNFFKNLKIIRKTVLYRTSQNPVIITGSGPGLETALPVIKKMQNNCLIIAASSSVMALANSGIQADIVIATDGGPWALHHIYPFYRTAENNTALAVNLCAALPSQSKDTPSLLLNDGSFWQSIVLHELGLPSIIIAQKGTVTASAVELALVLSSGNIYLAGMDLSIRDIRTHVRPYGFDYLLFSGSSRFMPVYSESFIRSNLLHDGGSMDIYAAWFKNQLNSWPKRIFSLGGNNEVFEKNLPSERASCNRCTATKVSRAAVKKTEDCFKTFPIRENPALLYRRGVNALLDAMNRSEYSQNLKTELIPMLFPGGNKVSEKQLMATVKDTADHYAKGFNE